MSAIAIPYFKNYVDRARASEFVAALGPLKAYASACIQNDACYSGHASAMASASYAHDYASSNLYVQYPTASNPNIGSYFLFAQTVNLDNTYVHCTRSVYKNWGASKTNADNKWSDDARATGCLDLMNFSYPSYGLKAPVPGNLGQTLFMGLSRSGSGANYIYAALIGVYSGCKNSDQGLGVPCSSYTGSTDDDVEFELQATTTDRNSISWKIPATSNCKYWQGGSLC